MYTLEIRPRGKAGLRRLDARIRERILNKLERFCQHCDTWPHKALKRGDRGTFSLPMNHDRAIYSFNTPARTVIVHRVGHRSRVY